MEIVKELDTLTLLIIMFILATPIHFSIVWWLKGHSFKGDQGYNGPPGIGGRDGNNIILIVDDVKLEQGLVGQDGVEGPDGATLSKEQAEKILNMVTEFKNENQKD